MSELSAMFDPGKSMSQAYGDIGQAQQYMQPFYEAGTQELPQYMSTLTSLTAHPTQLEDQIMGSYTESPYAQYQTNLLSKEMGEQAAAGGQLGTPNEQVDLANQEQGIVSKDQQQYYEDAMKPFQMGLQGEQYVTGLGMQAGESEARQEDIAAQMEAEEAKQKEGLLGGIVGAGTQLLGDI